MNCKLRKIRAKVVFFRELRGICVKKSGDFWTNEAGQRAKRGKHFAILAVLDEKHFAIIEKHFDFQRHNHLFVFSY